MNRLKGATCYLAGPMDRVADGGVGWRKWITPNLEELGIVVLDPCNKPIDVGIEDIGHRKQREIWKGRREFNKLSQDMKTIRVVDLALVDNANFLIVYWDTDVHMCGTLEEVFLSNRMKRPIYIMCRQGKSGMPDWMFGVCPHQYFHDSWSSLLGDLICINDGLTDPGDRWMFFDFMKLHRGKHE
jgi:hypothetical protein